MGVGFVASAEPPEHLAQREMRAPAIVEREARFEVGLCLAPELCPLAERAQHLEQRSVAIVAREPAFGLLQLTRRVPEAAFAVELDQLRVPLALEAAHDDLRRLAIGSELEEASRGRSGDTGLDPRRLRQPAPCLAQSHRVGGKRPELLALRRELHLAALRGVEHAALDELIDERRDVAEAARRLRRAELQAQRRRVQPRLALERAQDAQRFLRLPLLQRALRGEREAGDGEASRLRFGPREKLLG